MGQVAVEDLEQAHHGPGVHGLEGEQAAGTEDAVRLAQQRLEGGGRKVLRDLGREDAAEGGVGLRAEEVHEVALAHVEAARAALRRGVGARLHPPRRDAPGLQQLEELPAATPEVGHGREAFEEDDVGREALAQILGPPPEAALEGRIA